jgi:hypothetical protein
VSLALNRLAIKAADVQRADMPSRFTIRSPTVLKYGIVRTEKATKDKLVSAVGVSQQMTGPRKAFDYLGRFERPGVKVSTRGRNVAVPVEVRRTKRDLIAPSQRIKAFKFRTVGGQVKGLKRTFIVRPKSGVAAGLILQRYGRGKGSQLRLLYLLEPSVKIPPLLHLERNAFRTALREWQAIATEAVNFALKTRRA